MNGPIRITPVACLSDNYAYLVVDEATNEAAIVDASEAPPVLAALAESGARLVAVLSTHHHHDHVAGNDEVVARHPGVRVYGHASDRGRIPAQTDYLADGETFGVGPSQVRALHIPGHTLGAVAYVLGDAVFTGDTLFTGGCGRIFEGTPEMMHRSLSTVLGTLDDATRVYPGHEYTVGNLKFAHHVEPENRALEARLAAAVATRAEGRPTVGSTMGEERATNPFLRVDVPAIRASVGVGNDAASVEAFAAVRKAKDGFRA